MEFALYVEMQRSIANSANQDRLTSFIDNPKIKEMMERCIVAGTRGYQPPLLDDNGNLNEKGSSISELVKPIIEELDSYSEGYPYEPDKWNNADDLFLSATIPVSSIMILDVIARNCIYKERDFELLTTEQKEYQIDLDFKTLSGTIVPTQGVSTVAPVGEAITLSAIRRARRVPLTVMSVMVKRSGSPAYDAYVPTVTFDMKTRRELSTLYKFGLLDLRAFLAGSRGRPKHIVRPSTNALKLMLGLKNEGITLPS